MVKSAMLSQKAERTTSVLCPSAFRPLVLLGGKTVSLIGYNQVLRTRRWIFNDCSPASTSNARPRASSNFLEFANLKKHVSTSQITFVPWGSKRNLYKPLDMQGGQVELSVSYPCSDGLCCLFCSLFIELKCVRLKLSRIAIGFWSYI